MILSIILNKNTSFFLITKLVTHVPGSKLSAKSCSVSYITSDFKHSRSTGCRFLSCWPLLLQDLKTDWVVCYWNLGVVSWGRQCWFLQLVFPNILIVKCANYTPFLLRNSPFCDSSVPVIALPLLKENSKNFKLKIFHLCNISESL